VLVIAPHPDDEVGCGGTLLLHRRARDDVQIVYVTDGRASRAGGLAPEAMAQQRRREAALVAPLLGLATAHWLGLREREWEEPDLVRRLRDLLRDRSPEIIYAPSRVDFHPEHIRVARCVAEAIGGARARIRVYQLHVPLTPVLVNLVTPIASVEDELRQAMRGYVTQLGSIERCFRMKRYGGCFHGIEGLAEEFWEMDAAAYRRIHTPTGDRDRSFRGVRARPLTDPLAYLVGLRARQGLRESSRAG
jgi:LmbE family N-acetylglucosaminyl deacetylase